MKKLLFFVGSPLTSTALIYRVGILSKYLRGKNYDIKLVSVGDNYYNLKKNIVVNGEEIEIIGQAHYKIINRKKIPLSSINYLKEIIKTIIRFKKITKKFKPDLIQVFSSSPVSLFLAHYFKNKYKITIDIDDLVVGQAKKVGKKGITLKILDLLEEFIPKRMKIISVCSDFLRKKYPNSIKIPNMIETKKFRLNLREKEKKIVRKKYNINKNTIAFMSSITFYHGHFEILDYIKKSHGKFVFIGGGEGEDKLKKEIRTKNLDNKIIITGKIPQKEVIKILNSIKIGILPLWNEPIHLARHPLKLLEYLASGICIVANNVGEIKNCLNKKNSVLVEPGNIKSLIEKASNLKNPEKFSSKSLKIAKEFDVSRIIKKWEKFYEKILQTS